MREIKFRAWDTETKEMFIGIDNIKEKYEGIILFDELLNPKKAGCPELEIMQFTGLKDKNGKEIFEGDILEGRKIKGEVRFKDDCFMVFYDEFGIGLKGFINNEKPIEVKGNKFENPELLK